MANFLDEQIEVPRRTMVVFFIVDTSGSMQGAKIGAVNSAIEEVLPEIAKISDENADAEIKIAVLDFSTDAKLHIAKLNGRICGAKRSHSVSEQPNCYQSV